LDNWGLIPGWSRNFSPLTLFVLVLGPSQFPVQGVWQGSSPGTNWTEFESDCSPPCSANITNAQSFTSPPVCLHGTGACLYLSYYVYSMWDVTLHNKNLCMYLYIILYFHR